MTNPINAVGKPILPGNQIEIAELKLKRKLGIEDNTTIPIGPVPTVSTSYVNSSTGKVTINGIEASQIYADEELLAEDDAVSETSQSQEAKKSNTNQTQSAVVEKIINKYNLKESNVEYFEDGSAKITMSNSNKTELVIDKEGNIVSAKNVTGKMLREYLFKDNDKLISAVKELVSGESTKEKIDNFNRGSFDIVTDSNGNLNIIYIKGYEKPQETVSDDNGISSSPSAAVVSGTYSGSSKAKEKETETDDSLEETKVVVLSPDGSVSIKEQAKEVAQQPEEQVIEEVVEADISKAEDKAEDTTDSAQVVEEVVEEDKEEQAPAVVKEDTSDEIVVEQESSNTVEVEVVEEDKEEQTPVVADEEVIAETVEEPKTEDIAEVEADDTVATEEVEEAVEVQDTSKTAEETTEVEEVKPEISQAPIDPSTLEFLTKNNFINENSNCTIKNENDRITIEFQNGATIVLDCKRKNGSGGIESAELFDIYNSNERLPNSITDVINILGISLEELLTSVNKDGESLYNLAFDDLDIGNITVVNTDTNAQIVYNMSAETVEAMSGFQDKSAGIQGLSTYLDKNLIAELEKQAKSIIKGLLANGNDRTDDSYVNELYDSEGSFNFSRTTWFLGQDTIEGEFIFDGKAYPFVFETTGFLKNGWRLKQRLVT